MTETTIDEKCDMMQSSGTKYNPCDKIVAAHMAIEVIITQKPEIYHPQISGYIPWESQPSVFKKLLQEYTSNKTIDGYLKNFPPHFHEFITNGVYKINTDKLFDDCKCDFPHHIKGCRSDDPHVYIRKICDSIFGWF